MSLPPHLHVFIPSSSSTTSLEARLYLPVPHDAEPRHLPLSTSTRSSPIPSSAVARSALARLGIRRLVTASHPWSRLGGNMLDPAIAHHLLSAVFAPRHAGGGGSSGGDGRGHTAVLTFNTRGVGKSGKASWFDLGLKTDAADFAAVEQWGMDMLGGVQVWRFGYSWGSMAALTAPSPSPSSTPSQLPTQAMTPTLLLSPPLTIFRGLSLLSSRSFAAALTAVQGQAAKGGSVWVVFGTADEFTSASSYRALQQDAGEQGLVVREMEGAGHFWRGEDGDRMESVLREWLGGH